MDPPRDAPVLMAREAWVHHVLTRVTALPIVAAGELSGGHVWGLAVGAGRRGLEGHLALAWPRGGAIVVGLGTRGYQEEWRFFTWRVSRDVDRIELTTAESTAAGSTTSASVDAVRLYDAGEDGVRVFLAVVDDRDVVLRAARQLDGQGRVLATESLTKDQKGFEASRRWVDDVRRYGLDGHGRPAYPKDP